VLQVVSTAQLHPSTTTLIDFNGLNSAIRVLTLNNSRVLLLPPVKPNKHLHKAIVAHQLCQSAVGDIYLLRSIMLATVIGSS
jgi:hypothetical protein